MVMLGMPRCGIACVFHMLKPFSSSTLSAFDIDATAPASFGLGWLMICYSEPHVVDVMDRQARRGGPLQAQLRSCVEERGFRKIGRQHRGAGESPGQRGRETRRDARAAMLEA